MKFGAKVKERRVRRGISQGELAKAAEVTQSAICQIEQGTILPSLTVAAAIAQALGCSMDDLLF